MVRHPLFWRFALASARVESGSRSSRGQNREELQAYVLDLRERRSRPAFFCPSGDPTFVLEQATDVWLEAANGPLGAVLAWQERQGAKGRERTLQGLPIVPLSG